MAAKKKTAKKARGILQPEVNIGIFGHVDHGKTTLLQCLSGKWADTHSEEIKRGITIRLGYADCVFAKTKEGRFTTEADALAEKAEYDLLRKVSFVDAPGHESLMATMLSGATIIDGALLLVAANEQCPQPQTREHVMALQIIGVQNLVIVQNKIDLVSEEQAIMNYEQIKAFVTDTSYKDAPIIPLSAQHKVGISNLIQALEEVIPTPERNTAKDPLLFIARSFDINKPGTEPEKLVGGVLGGSLKQGILRVGDEIEIRPGYDVIEKNKRVWKPLQTTIVGLKSGGESIEEVMPGGSFGVLTSLDPSVIKSDKLVGGVAGHIGKLPDILEEFTLDIHLLDRVVGVNTDVKVEPIRIGEPLMLNVNAAATVGSATKIKKGRATFNLKLPVCAYPGSRVTISRMLNNRFRLIGYGIIEG